MENVVVTVDREELRKLIFQVYERGNISTEIAANMLHQPVGEFVEDFESWQCLP